MTNSQPHINPPTAPQLSYLKDLERRTGQTFTYPQTFNQASAEIERLKRAPQLSAAERRLETRELREDFATARGDAAAVRPDEIGGYGAHATMLVSSYDREVKVLEDQIRELHPRRGDSQVCREAYESCCDELRALSPFSFRRVMCDLGGGGAW
jgi:hypothetical protein